MKQQDNKALDAIADTVLAYRPSAKSKPAVQRKRRNITNRKELAADLRMHARHADDLARADKERGNYLSERMWKLEANALRRRAREHDSAIADAVAFSPELIEGVGLVFNRYNGKTNEKELATRLAAVPHGVRGLLRRVESQRERTGNQKAQCVAATVVDIYNKALGPRSGERLPDWWATQD